MRCCSQCEKSVSFIVDSWFSVYLGIIILFRKYREPSQRMIAHLSLSSCMYGIAYLMEDITAETTWVCKLQAALISMFIWASFLWIMCILFNLYFQLLFQFDIRKVELPVTAFCWLLPIVLMGLPFTEDAYEPAGVWCWVRNEFKWRFAFWYIWRIVFLVVLTVVVIHISIKPHKARADRHSSTVDRTSFESDMRTLRLYPVLYFIVNIFPIVSRTYSSIHGRDGESQYNFVLLLLHAFLTRFLAQ